MRQQQGKVAGIDTQNKINTSSQVLERRKERKNI
jgi:hypothetical protein